MWCSICSLKEGRKHSKIRHNLWCFSSLSEEDKPEREREREIERERESQRHESRQRNPKY